MQQPAAVTVAIASAKMAATAIDTMVAVFPFVIALAIVKI